MLPFRTFMLGLACTILLGVLQPSPLSAQCSLVELIGLPSTVGDEFGAAVAFDGVHMISGSPTQNSATLYRFEGNGWSTPQLINAGNVNPTAEFGRSVAIDGTVIAIGAPGDDEAATDAGAILVFRFNGTSFVQEAKLTASDAALDDRLGTSVAIESGLIVAGAPSPSDPTVYTFQRSGGAWSEVDRLTPTPMASNPTWAENLSLDGRRLVVTTNEGIFAGRADLFEWESGSWTEETSLTLPIGMGGEAHGPVSLHGDRLAVGSPTTALGTGSVDVYHHDGTTWNLDETITEGGTTNFGASVALDGDTLVVGAPGTTISLTTAGRSYAYERRSMGWGTGIELNSAPVTGNNQGRAVDVSAGIAVVGIPRNGFIPTQGGSVEAFALDFASTQRLVSSTPFTSDWFGGAVSTFGARAFIGELRGRQMGVPTGSVIIRQDAGTGWTEETELFGSGTLAEDRFGSSVDVYGSLLAVSAPQQSNDDGGVYVYRFDGTSWNETDLLLPSEAVGNGWEVGRVEIENEFLAIGVPLADDGMGSDDLSGAVYLFDRDSATDSWSPGQILRGTGLGLGDTFGAALDVEKDLLVVGAPGFTAFGGMGSAGAVYVYRFDGSTWVEEAFLAAAIPIGGERFGARVAAWGQWIAVTSIRAGTNGERSGSVTMFRFDGTNWIETQTIAPPWIGPFDEFGANLAMDDGLLAITSTNDDVVDVDSGSVSLYRWVGTQWVPVRRFASLEPDPVANFGVSVALESGRLVIGEWLKDSFSLTDAGSARAIGLSVGGCEQGFQRADADQNGMVELADVIELLDELFNTQDTTCLDALDVNASGALSITDVLQLLYYLFGPNEFVIPAPSGCDSNVYGPGLGCTSFGACP